jgi:hypothetical protein
MSQTKETQISRKGIILALGIICIILIAGLVGTIAAYISMIDDKNNTISSLNTQISKLDSSVTRLKQQITSDNATINSLTSNVTSLQKQPNSILNGSTSPLGIIMSDPSAWVNKTVMVEGTIRFLLPPSSYGPFLNLGKPVFPPVVGLSSLGTTIGIYFAASYNGSSYVYSGSGENVTVQGVVTELWTGETGSYANGTSSWLPSFAYFIEVESIWLL